MKTKLKIFKKRFISVFMAVILFLGCFGYALGQSETAQAAISSPMRISKDGSIVWGTTSHANPKLGKAVSHNELHIDGARDQQMW